MIIYRTQVINGAATAVDVADVPVTAKAVHKATLMKEDFIKLVFDSDVDYKFKAGDWVELEAGGMPYILADDYFPSMKDEATFSYELQFNAPWYNLDKVMFLFNTYEEGVITKRESDWYITDTAQNILSLVIRTTKDADRKCPCVFNDVLDCEPTVVKTFTFSSTSILSALNNLAKEFELEWWVTYEGGEYYLHFGECDNSITRDANGAVTFDGSTNVRVRNSALAVELTSGENVTKPSVSQKEGLKKKYYVFGSSRNIDQNAVQDMEAGFVTSIVTKRLELAGNPQVMPEGSGEEVVIFDDIYPRSDYQISGVTPVEIITDEVIAYDEQGNPSEYKRYNVYNLQIEGFSDYIFSLIQNDPNVQNVEDIIASGKPLSLKFITKEMGGQTHTPLLAGFEFELSATLVTDENTGNSWYEFQIQHQDINGYIIPNDNLIPQTGDWVCIFNVKGKYIGGTGSNDGQADLRAAFNKWYANKKRDVSYTIKPYANEDIDLNIGDAVVLNYKDNSVSSRVYSYEKTLDIVLAGLGCSDASYTISSYAKTGSVNQLKEDVKVLTASIANGTAGGSMDASAVQNAIATYGRRLFLSKTTEDKADGHITFKEGITSKKNANLEGGATFGTFESGFLGSGAMIDQYGNAEVKSLYAREFISTPEFRFNRITVTEGEQWNTNAFGIIEDVRVINGNNCIVLHLEDGDLPSVKYGDLCRGIYSNIGYSQENNATPYDLTDHDANELDDCNFPTKIGFFTSYFMATDDPMYYTDEDGKKHWYFPFITKSQQSGSDSTPLPCKNMKFAQYGNPYNSDRQSSFYQTSIRHSYIQQLEHVDSWEIHPWNIASRYGYLGDLTVTLKNTDGSTYNTTLQGNGLYVQDNVYFGNATIQLDPVTIEDIKNQLANYSIQLSAYTDVIKVDDAGNVIEGLWTDTGEAPNISRQYRIFSVITARNGITPLTIEENDVPCGKGKFKVYMQPYGCSCKLENSTLYITHIDNVKDGIAGTEDDVDFDYDACRAMERVWVDLRVECEGVGSILATMPITIKHDPVPYIIADLTNENASVSWSSDEERYIGLPVETYVNMAKGNEDLRIDGLVVNTINGLVPNWSSFQWDTEENAYVYEEEVDYFHPSPTAGWRILITPQYMAETNYAPAVGDEDNPLAALIRVVKMPINAPSITEILFTCTTEYAGVYYERTLSLHIARFADVAIWDIIPTHRSVSVDRNAFFNYPYVGVNVFCTDKSGRRAVTTLPSGFRLLYKISEVISSFTPVLNPTGNPAEQGWFELDTSGEEVLPYDAQVEYLQSSGTQYIDTGIVATTNFECEIKAEFTQNQAGFDTLLGSLPNNTSNYGVALAISGSDLHAGYIQFGTSAAVSSVKTLGLHTYKSSLKNNVLKIDVDGTEDSSTLAGTFSTIPMYLFARNKGSGTIGNYSKAKVYYCKIWNGGNLVFDAIPVRVGQVGYMYDKVSGQLFGNSGTGSFTLGEDITPIEYLQATGTQYIDTGINAQSVTRFVVDGCCYPDSGNNTQLLGGTAQGAGTFFGARVNNGTFWYCMANGNGLGDPTHRSTIDATIVSTSSQTGTLADLVSGTTSNFTSFSSGSWQFPNENLLLFGGYSTRRSPNARCYSLQIYTSSGLVRDFIPVSVGGVGYLYDKISNKLFGNAGTGNFTLGSEVTQEVSQNQGSQSQDYVVTTDTSVVSGKTYYVHSYASVDSEPVILSDPTSEVRVNDPSYADTIKSIIFTLLNESVEVADEEEVLVVREGIGGQGSTGPAGNGVQQVTDYYLRAKDGFTPHYPDPLGYIPEGTDAALVETAQGYPSGWRANTYTPPTKGWPNVWHFTKYDYTSSPDYDTTPSLITTYSEDGNNIVGIHTYYLRTNEDNVNNLLRDDQGGTGWLVDTFIEPDNSNENGHGRFVWRYFAFQYSKEVNGSYYMYSPIEFVAKFVEDGTSFQCAYKVFPTQVNGSDYTPSLDNVSTGADMPKTNNSSWSGSTNGLVVGDGYALWMTQRTYKGATYNNWGDPVRISGYKGETGADGTDIEFIYKLSNDGNPTSAEKPTYDYDEVHDTYWQATIEGIVYKFDSDDFNPSDVPNATGSNLGWTDNPSGVDKDHKYEWACQRTKKKGSAHWGGWVGPFVWSAYGDTGMDGDGVEYVFIRQEKKPVKPHGPAFSFQGGSTSWDDKVYEISEGVWRPEGWTGGNFTSWLQGDYNPQGEWIPHTQGLQGTQVINEQWKDNPSGVSGDNPVEWVSVRKRINGKWHGFSDPAVWATYSETPDIKIVGGYWYLGDDYLRDDEGKPVKAEGQDGTGIALKDRVSTFNDLLAITPVPKKGDCYVVTTTRHLWVYIGDEAANHTIVASDWQDMGEFQGAAGANSQLHFAWARSIHVHRDQEGKIDGISEFITAYEELDPNVDYEWMGIATTNSVDNPTKKDPSEWDAYKWNHVKGRDGEFFERIYMTTSKYVAPEVSSYDNSSESAQSPEFLPYVGNLSDCGASYYQFYDDPMGDNMENGTPHYETYPYEWMLERKKVDGVWQPFSTASLWARHGKDGEGVSRVDTYYLKTTMSVGVTYSTQGWVANTYQTPDIDKPYVWRYSASYVGQNLVGRTACELIAVYNSAPNVNLLDDTAFSSDAAMEAWTQKGHVSGDPTADPKNANYNSQQFDNFFGVTTGTQGYNAYYGRFKGTGASGSYVILLEQNIIDVRVNKIEAGKWYTLSYWVKGNSNSMFDVTFRGLKGNTSTDYVDKIAGMYINGTLIKNIHSYQFKYNSGHYSSEWSKHVITFKVVDNLDIDTAYILWAMYDRTTEHQIYICMPKLEVGMVATTYSNGQTSTKVFPRTGEWEAGKQYFAGNFGEPYIDAVHSGVNNFGYPAWYRCIRTHVSSDENSPTSANSRLYWDAGSWDGFLATGLFLAQEAYIENLVAKILRTGEPLLPHVEMEGSVVRFFGDNGILSIELATDLDGVGVLRFYDASGNAMYDLGPQGITNQVQTEATRYTNFLVFKISSQTTIGDLLRVVSGDVVPLETASFAVRYELHEGYARVAGVVKYNISENSRPSTWNMRLYKNNSYTDSMFKEAVVETFTNFMEDGWYIDPNCGPNIDLGSDWATMEFHKYQNGKITSIKVLKFSRSEVVNNQQQAYCYDEQGTRKQLVIGFLD